MMATNQNATMPRTISAARAGVSSPSYQAYRILHLAFIVAPIVAGLETPALAALIVRGIVAF